MPSALAALADALHRSGADLGGLALAWARATPAVVLVPAFGLRALPLPARAVLGVALGAVVYPALPAEVPGGGPLAWGLALLVEAARGLPVALAAAVPLWAATMAGGLVDAVRGSQEVAPSPTVEGEATALGVPLSIVACAIFLATEGPARVAAALVAPASSGHPVVAAADDLVAGISLAVALGGPLLVASVVVEVAGALVARAASPAQVHALLSPARALATLAVLGLVLERMAAVLARAVQRAP